MVKDMLNWKFTLINDHTISISQILAVVIIFIVAKIFVLVVTKITAPRYFKKKRIDRGRQYAFKKIIRYFVYTFSIIISIQTLGFNISLLLAGSAALLVGIGLGLQQTFNDLISGIILLFEGSVKKGDVVEINNMVGVITTIGMRTSIMESRDKVMVIVPNSKLVTDNVINWSHIETLTRFHIVVGVAYGSNVPLVREVLINTAAKHASVAKDPGPNVRFLGFGDSSLDFDLLIWTKDIVIIEDIKSEIRFDIEEAFRQNKITIPFPQRDLHLKSSNINLG